MGIGIHVGDVVENNIGTDERVKFGVVGDTVNLAARIQDRSRDGKHVHPGERAVESDTETFVRLRARLGRRDEGKAAPSASSIIGRLALTRPRARHRSYDGTALRPAASARSTCANPCRIADISFIIDYTI